MKEIKTRKFRVILVTNKKIYQGNFYLNKEFFSCHKENY